MVASIMTGSPSQQGFAYMALLTLILMSLLALSVAMPDLQQQAQREKEAQFIFAGTQYYNAIKRFYNSPHVSIQRYPKSLDELLVDTRSLKPIYHLRRLYPDPMRPDGQWGLVYNENAEVIGVQSLSDQLLIKTHLPDSVVTVALTGAALKHSDLQFVYQPNKNSNQNTMIDDIVVQSK